jgi:anti-sigma factor ChrR (cupin superfamily)
VTRDLIELLPELALGTLPEAEKAAVEAELAASPALRQELDRIVEILGSLPSGLGPEEPSPGARGRLLATLAGPERFAPFVDRLARMLELRADELGAVLARIDDPAGWRRGFPGVTYIDFTPGPRLAAAGAQAGLVRLEAGGTFPRHRHLGPEVVLVLEGTAREGGVVYHPGQLVEHAEGTEHEFSAGRHRDLVTVSLHYGIEAVPVTPR